MRTKIRSDLLCMLVALVSLNGMAMAAYKIDWSATSSGGVIGGTGSSHNLSSILGLPAAGPGSSSGFALWGGYFGGDAPDTSALGIPGTEYDALGALYTSTNGPGWTNHTNWLTVNTPWYGVTASGGHVTQLLLDGNNLSGQIPADIQNLGSLTWLSLCCNQLTSIPGEIGNLTNLLGLNLSFNQLTSIPSGLGGLTSLQELWLNDNQLTGSIPNSIGGMTSLQKFNLSQNGLTGQIPTQIGSMTSLQHLWLNNNQLSGQIPAEISNLTSVQEFILHTNHLAGPIPNGIGNLASVQNLNLSQNALTGSIPGSIGNLANLHYLSLNENHLEGQIPTDIGNLANLQLLLLHQNKLSGQIPSDIGKLTNLQWLRLDGNLLNGQIPASIVNLTQLVGDSDHSSLHYNGLAASGTSLLQFLTLKFPGWDQAQTVPPTGVSATGSAGGRATVSWIPILYTGDSGYYEVGFSTVAGGPYTFLPQNRTTGKSATSLTLSGLPFGGVAHLAVRTVTLANYSNQSDVTSLPSDEVTAAVYGSCKVEPDGTPVTILGAVITATFPGESFFYVESPDMSWGIGVDAPAPEPSGIVDITGTIQTDAVGNRYIAPSEVFWTDSGSVTPLAMTNKVVGGGPWNWNAVTGAGQRGIKGSKGLNNIGLLIRTCGRVTQSGRGWFYVDDGSGVSDGTGFVGLYVDASELPILAGPQIPLTGSYVAVTGISTCDEYLGNTVNTVLATMWGY